MSRTFPWLLPIHLTGDASNLFDALRGQVIAPLHQQEDPPELGEVRPLLGLERVILEEWDDASEQMLLASYAVGHPVAVIPSNHSATEMGLQRMKHLSVPLVLYDGEFRKHLEARLHFGMRIDPYVKAAFTVDEPHDPLSFEIHKAAPNIKSLRVLIMDEPSLRIVPVSAGF
jgi:hypothetical protein